ncbi:AAA family ATPase [Candidatus Woesearchaeota archaeon]|nr:AAA family ATPase [Candidatus Woesearchaeota archaeon]
MSLFDGMLKGDESLFVNEIVLDYDYLPKLLPFRENQQFYLASCVRPLFQGRNGKNVLISGMPGIGKTAAIKFVLRDLENQTNDIDVVYVNCWKKSSAHKIVLEICDKIGYKWTANKNTDELMKSIAIILNKKAVIIALDEVDKLEEQQIIYLLLEEIEKKCLFLITNEEDWLDKLDSRIKSRLVPEVVNFEPYNQDETFKILKQRADAAFVPGVWNEEAMQKIADKAYEFEDIRLGLFLLREAGNVAEMKGSKKIIEEYALKAIEKVHLYSAKKPENLTEEEKLILEMVKLNSGKSALELYELYKTENNKSYRTFYRKLKTLEVGRFLTINEVRMANGGLTSAVEMGIL